MLEHNKIVYDEVIERLKISSRVCIVQATGTGKGVIASSLIEDYVNVLVIAPTNAILENYRMNLGVNSENVIFYTYQGISMLLNNQIEELGEKVSLIILDEFHRIGAETWGRKVEMLCDRAESKGCKTVGLSATPVRYLDNERDMSEEFFKGNVVNGLNIVDAVVSGVLPTFKYVVSYYGYEKDLFKKLEERKEKVSDEIKQILSNLENNYSIGKIIQKETKELSNNQKWIVFFSKIEELEEFKENIYSWFNGKVNIFTLHSNSNYSGNMKVLKEFNDSNKDINVLLSVNMLNEGVHIKDIDGVIMLRKTISPIVYLQQLGRALQIGGKSPIIFDFICNFKRLSKYEDFRFNIIEEINSKLKVNEQESIKERKIIVGSYCEEIFELLEKLNFLTKVRWTEEEDKLLIENFKIMTAKEIQESILSNRSVKSIYKRLEKLGMYNRKLSERKKRNSWTSEEIDILNKYFNSEDVDSILIYFPNRDKKSVLQKAENLGIYTRNKRNISPNKPYIWSDEEDEILKKYFLTEGYEVIKRLKNKNKVSVKNRIRKLNLQTILYNYNNNNNNIWTEEEKEILKKHYKHLGSAIPELLLNRSVESIRTQATKLGLRYERQNIWSDEDIELLKENYSKLGTSIVSILPNRSKLAVESKARALGLKFVRPGVWSEEEIAILKENFYSLGYSISGTLLNRSVEAIKHKVKELCLSPNSNNVKKWTAEEELIMRLYYSKENITKLCSMLNRSKDSIYKKAVRMGLKNI